MNICVIPARGGSKRIPRKNIRIFDGKPLIFYSIDQAKKTELFEHIIVSTDDEEIADVAQGFGAEVPFMRPAELADDYANTFDLMQHASSWIGANWKETKYICCLYATAPLVQAKYIVKGYKVLSEKSADYTYSITEFSFPIQRSVRKKGEFVIPASPENMLKRSQDLEPHFHDAAQFYWGSVEAFSEKRDFFGTRSIGIQLPRYQVVDIDTPEDWEMAEIQYQVLHKKGLIHT